MPLDVEEGLLPGDFVLDGDPGTQLPLPKKGAEPPPQLSAHVYCRQTAGWIKMTFGMEVGLGPGHIMLGLAEAYLHTKWHLDASSSLPQKGAEPPA